MSIPPNKPIRNSSRSVSRSGEPARGPQKISEVLSGLLARRGYAQVQLASDYGQAWQEAAGEQFALHSRPGIVRRGVLEVAVRNSAVLQELTFRKKHLLQQLDRLLPQQNIRDLRFRVAAID
jgi:predicted nucleic acid-binding Zn ribbon protein